MTPEKRVQNSILAYFTDLEKEGQPIFFERRQAGGFNYKMGIPDLYAVFNGQHVEVEVKAPGETLRPMQIRFSQKCKEKHILYICSDDLSQVKQFFNEHFNI